MLEHQLEEELHETKELLCRMQEERNKATEELEELKKVAEEANLRMDEALTTRKPEVDVKDKSTDLDSMQLDSIEQHKSLDDIEPIHSSARIELCPTAPNSSSNEGIEQHKSLDDIEHIHSSAHIELCPTAPNPSSNDGTKQHKSLDDIEKIHLLTHVEACPTIPNPSSKGTENLKPEESMKDNELVVQLEDKDAALDKLKKEEMDNVKESEDHATTSLQCDCKNRIQELELELEKRKESEANLYDSLVRQTKQLEQNMILLEESKLENASLGEKLKKLERFAPENGVVSIKETAQGNSETEAQPSAAEEDGKHASVKVETLQKEMHLLRNELRLACEAEEYSKKAMDDLALALKEVATEANQVKEKLNVSQLELEQAKGEAERLRVLLETTEDNYKELLDDARKEADRHKNTSERLILEVEESLSAWNLKETEFVNCIKRIEEERSSAQKKTSALIESLRVAEHKSKESKGENQKLRDILKQALNEASVAKEAAGIARTENAELQDSLAGKEEALNLLAQENETLKMKEVASHESIKELKRLLLEAAEKELKKEDKDKDKEKEKEKEKEKSSTASEKELKIEDKDKSISAKEANKELMKRRGRTLSAIDGKNIQYRGFTCSIRDFIVPGYKQYNFKEEDDDSEAILENDDDVKGSIFYDVDSPDSPSPPHHDMESNVHSDHDFDQIDDSGPLDDMESDRNSRKRRALLRKVGDLIRRSSHKREPSMALEQ